MPEITAIDADLPAYRAAVKFRNEEKPCLVVTADKAASYAKNFREAAALLNLNSGERDKRVAAWLNEMAGIFTVDQ